jgi:Carbohydrate binding domain (family 11)
MSPSDQDPDSSAAEGSDDDAAPLPRLSVAGSGFERLLLGSGQLDSAAHGVRERTHTAARYALDVVRARQRQRQRRAGLLVAATLLALLAGAWLWTTRHPPLAFVPQPEPLPPGPRVSATPVPSSPVASPPALPPCRKLSIGTGGDPLIDDFEDGNARLLLRDGRSGAWVAEGDRTGKQTPSPSQTAFPIRASDAGRSGHFALRLRTERLTGNGAGLRADFAPAHCYDASAYAGIAFWAKGPGRIHFGLTMVDVMEAKWGGLCEKDCYDRHFIPADLTPEWRRYTARWEDFEQAGWGHQVAFDAKRLLSMDFTVQNPDTPIEFWIDDIEFLD